MCTRKEYFNCLLLGVVHIYVLLNTVIMAQK